MIPDDIDPGCALLVVIEKMKSKRLEISRLEEKLSDVSTIESTLKVKLEDNMAALSCLMKGTRSLMPDRDLILVEKYNVIREITEKVEELEKNKENLRFELSSHKNDMENLRKEEKRLKADHYVYTSNHGIQQSSSANTEDDDDGRSTRLELVKSKLELEGFKREFCVLQELRLRDQSEFSKLQEEQIDKMIALEDTNTKLQNKISRLRQQLLECHERMSKSSESVIPNQHTSFTQEDKNLLQKSFQVLIDQKESENKSLRQKMEENATRLIAALEAQSDELCRTREIISSLQTKVDEIPKLEKDIGQLQTTLQEVLSDLSVSRTELQQAKDETAAQAISHNAISRKLGQAAAEAADKHRQSMGELSSQLETARGRADMFGIYRETMGQTLTGLKRDLQLANEAQRAAEDARLSAENALRHVQERELAWLRCEIVGGAGDGHPHSASHGSDDEGQTSDDGSDSDSRMANRSGVERRAGDKTAAEMQLDDLRRQLRASRKREEHLLRMVEDMRRLVDT